MVTIVIVATISATDGSIVAGPDIISRGFVYVRESEDLMEQVKEISKQAISDCLIGGTVDWSTLKNEIKNSVTNYLLHETNRRPMILPVIMEI